MADGNLPGWEPVIQIQQDMSEKPVSGEYKATIPGITKTGTGGVVTPKQTLKVNTNTSTGNFDVYEPNLFGDKPIYSYNASNNKIVEKDKTLYKQYFSGTAGAAQLNNTNKLIKESTLKLAKNDAGSNPTPEKKKQLDDLKKSDGYKSTANKSSTDPNETPVGPAETGEVFGGTKTTGFGSLTYPLDLGKTKQDVIKFTMLEYKPSGTGATQRAGTSARKSLSGKELPEGRISAGTVVLPIPNGISDTNSADWNDNSLNAYDAAMAAAAFKGITEGIGKGVEDLGKTFTAAGGDENFKKGGGALFAGAATGTNSAAILSRAEGVVINPNLELLFNAPTLRPFSFIFKMSARGEDEAREIIKILNFFKRGMSPIKTESNLFLKTPNTFKIQYLHRRLGEGADHPYIGRIKECALQSVTVNYTPEGQYATYSDGVMVSYEMQMQFKELEPVFNSDYDGLKGIGY